ncbi:putative elongation factor 1-alpha 1 [Paratrimastix pyriformis]|uniref:Elongation factor 1-alpha 1 n=1 Tax=Paratrimastix pyriformis TaxID=342808 RepID=A0ABQ8URP2_9EUKA|nr:putative elongation factor 1-alpha 1 [Paratrimastix pyriformis]
MAEPGDYFALVPDEILALIISNLPRVVHSVAKKLSRRFLIVGLQTHPKGSNINIAFLGHVDSGKSTVLGHLMCNLGVVAPEEVEKNARASEALGALGHGSLYAWFTDRLKTERERGISVQGRITPRIQLAEGVTCNFVDLPGHRDFLKNTLRYLSCADVHVLVVAASMGEFEASATDTGAVPLHTVLSYATNIHHQMATRRGRAPPLVVAVNKMDTVGESEQQQQRFTEIQEELGAALGQLHARTPLGFGPLGAGVIPMVPISGWLGENLTAVHHLCPWYEGPSLVDAMLSRAAMVEANQPGPLLRARMLQATEAPMMDQLRFQVMDNFYDKRAVIGLVRSGEMRVGQMIRFVGSASPLSFSWIAWLRVCASHFPCSIQGFLPPEFERLAKRRRDDVVHHHLCPTSDLPGRLLWNHPLTGPAPGRPWLHGHTTSSGTILPQKRFPDRYAVEVRGVVASMQLDGKPITDAYQGDLVGITLDNTQYRVGGCVSEHIIPAKACASPPGRGTRTLPGGVLPVRLRGGTDMDATLGTVMPSNERHVHLSLQEHQVDQPAPGALVTPLYTTFIAEIMVRPSRSAGGFPAQAGIKVGYAPRIHVQAGVSTARVLEIFFAKPKPGAPVPPASIADPRNREWMDCLGPEAEAHRSAVEKRWLSGVACLMGMGRAFLELCARSTHEQYDVAQWVPRPARLRVGERGVVRFGLDMPMFMDLYRSYVMRADAIPDPRTRGAVRVPSKAATSSPFGLPPLCRALSGVFVLTNGRDLVGLGKVIAFD